MSMRRLLLTVAIALAAGQMLAAENWPQWRGPHGTGVSRETNLPAKWSATENVAWRVALPGLSGATPIIWGEHVFLNVAEGGELFLWALDRNGGAVRWKRPLSGGDQRMRKQNMSSPSPVTDGQHVWVMTGTGVLKAFSFEGQELWARNIQQEYGAFGLNWGYASSPLLHDGALYVQVLHGMKTDDPSYVMRIDAKSGKTAWRTERPTKAIRESPDAYTTPVLLRTGNRTEIVVSGGDIVTAYDPASGKELWRSDGLNPENHPFHRIVASPVVLENVVYAPSRERPLLAIRGGGRATSRRRTASGSSTAGRTCRRRPPTAPTSTWSTTAASSSAWTPRRAKRSTDRSASRQAPTAHRRPSPTARCT
jgi:outer membrane protein assembly factor BamB